jgi:hypothetical protein
MLIEKLLIALAVMFLCTFIHAVFMIVGYEFVDHRRAKMSPVRQVFRRTFLIWLFIMWMFLGICVEASVWALMYLYNPAITMLPDAQSAFYFSMVTYTSLGYGDIVLIGDWRILSAFQAANGVIIFGWTTALIFYFIQRIYNTDAGPRGA